MRIYKASYRIYVAARAVLRATGLVRLFRPFIGANAAKFVFKASGNTSTPLSVLGHRMLLAPPGSYASPDMVAGKYEIGTTRLFEQLVEANQVVVDIGSHVGYYTLLAARLVGPGGKVYSFEAEPQNYDLLVKNINLNGYANVISVPRAVSDQCADDQLFLSGLDNGSHSLYWLGLPMETNQKSLMVESTTLDAFLADQGWPKIDLIKIDVEGAEPLVFTGMQQFLGQTPNLKMIVEFCPWILETTGVKPAEFTDHLASLGFHVSLITPQVDVPLADLDYEELVNRLLRKDGYANLYCVRP